jgi:hypothetical protein
MADQKDDEQQLNMGPSQSELSLADELGIEELCDPIFGGRGRLFSAAGRQSPVAEFTKDFLVLHPPQKPFYAEGGPTEDITFRSTDEGILLNEIGAPKTVGGAKYRGRQVYWLRQQEPRTGKHYAGWIDDDGAVHVIKGGNAPITTFDAVALRNTTHDGEISLKLDPGDIEEDDEVGIDESNDFDDD